VRAVAGGAELRVHVQPGVSRPGLAGLHGQALRIRLRARAVEGAANRELLEQLADALGVRRADLSIAAGEHGRAKRVVVRGLAADEVRARLARQVAG
jgi:uncharacterized protein (TIGR00251 family)